MDLAKTELSQLHAATCLAITQYNQGRQCPCLANRIVLLLKYLITHPDLPLTQASKDVYLNLLDHWQEVSDQFKEQQYQQNAKRLYH
jgi:hypothetical protein